MARSSSLFSLFIPTLLCTSILSLVACGADDFDEQDPDRADIFGVDDREEFYSDKVSDSQRAVTQATAALVDPRILRDHGEVQELRARTIGDVYDLCEGTRFAEQRSAAFCSSFFIGNQEGEEGAGLLVTAAHCLDEGDPQAACDNTKVVFDYTMPPQWSEAAPYTVLSSSVYQCKDILMWDRFKHIDYAVFRVDRKVTRFASDDQERRGMEYRRKGESRSEHVYASGYPTGVPQKITGLTKVKEYTEREVISATGVRRTDSMVHAPLDIFQGNSGGPILGADHVVEGVAVAGVSGSPGYESSVSLFDPRTWFDEDAQCYGPIEYGEEGNWRGKVPKAFSLTVIADQLDAALNGEIEPIF